MKVRVWFFGGLCDEFHFRIAQKFSETLLVSHENFLLAQRRLGRRRRRRGLRQFQTYQEEKEESAAP